MPPPAFPAPAVLPQAQGQLRQRYFKLSRGILSDVNFSGELGLSLCQLRAAAPRFVGSPGQLLWRTWNRTWEGLGATCLPLQKDFSPPACLLHQLCVPSAAAQHLDLCLALSMLRGHHNLNTQNSSTFSMDHWEGAQLLQPGAVPCRRWLWAALETI